jgi:HSP20 family protein
VARHLIRWDPMREVTSLRDDMDRLFDSMIGRYPAEHTAIWAPALDVEETKDAVIVRTELPGMKKEEIKISVSGDELCISGERRHEAEEKGKTFHRIERAYGKFQRSLVLPADVQGDKAKAAYTDGVLELTLPKSEKAKSHEIAIN